MLEHEAGQWINDIKEWISVKDDSELKVSAENGNYWKNAAYDLSIFTSK